MSGIEKTGRELVAAANDLARMFYQGHGYVVKDDFKFYDATHPQEVGMWNLAVMAYDHIEGTDIQECLYEMQDEDEDEEAAAMRSDTTKGNEG